MWATGGVEAIFGDQETFHGFAVHDMRFDDLVNVVCSHSTVPDGVRVNNHGWSVFALVKAS